MNKKENTTSRFLRAIFIMQAIGFITICTLKYNIDLYSSEYRNVEAKSYVAMIELESLIADVYQHENIVSKYTVTGEEKSLSQGRKECQALREKAENEIIKCDIAFKDLKNFAVYEEFLVLKSSITAYFNCADFMFFVREERSFDMTSYLFENRMVPYINSANDAMNKLQGITDIELDNTKVKMSNILVLSRISFIVGIVIFFIATMIFIWYCKRMLNEQEKYMHEAESANRAKSAFLSNMSHEIRTPINAIIGMNEMIARNSTDPKIIGYSGNIESSSKSLLSLVNDVLDFSRIEAGKMELIVQQYDLRELIKDAWLMIYLRAQDKNLSLVTNIDENLPYNLSGDSNRIKQILVNLLTNAVKYTEKGSVSLCVSYSFSSESEILLKFTVKDTGIGLNPNEIEKLTRPFERLDENRTKSIEGSGLGLSIVTNLLLLMDSKLEVSSIYGQGSEFSFAVIQKVNAWDKIGVFSPSKDNKKSISNKGPLFTASKATVLVVDDNEMNRIVLVELLKRTLINVELATGGREAVSKAAVKKYDLILMDHRMPEVDGLMANRMIKENGLNKTTPVIVVTANAVTADDTTYIDEGFKGYILKPVNSTDLENIMYKNLSSELIDDPVELLTFVDKNAGLEANGGSKEIYEKVIESYVISGETEIESIKKYISENDIKNYTIKVHALKSASRLVGATYLGELAYELEKCGDSGDVDTIHEKTEMLINALNQVIEKLNSEYSILEKEDLLEYDAEYVQEILTAMSESCDAFDFDMVDKALKELDKYKLPDSMTQIYKELKVAIYAVDRDNILILCNRMRGL